MLETILSYFTGVWLMLTGNLFLSIIMAIATVLVSILGMRMWRTINRLTTLLSNKQNNIDRLTSLLSHKQEKIARKKNLKTTANEKIAELEKNWMTAKKH